MPAAFDVQVADSMELPVESAAEVVYGFPSEEPIIISCLLKTILRVFSNKISTESSFELMSQSDRIKSTL